MICVIMIKNFFIRVGFYGFFFKIYQKSRERYRKYRRRFLYRIEIIENVIRKLRI